MQNENGKSNLRRNLLNLLLIAVGFLFVTACVCADLDDERSNGRSNDKRTSNTRRGNSSDSGNRGSKDRDTDNGAVTNEPDGDKTTNAADDRGDFIVNHGEVQNEKYSALDKEVREKRVLEDAAQDLNKALKLPYDITLQTQDCGAVNAFYKSSDRSITVCYELMEHYYQLYKSNGSSEDKALAEMNDVLVFIFLHELGHALIDAYQLDITGREEDAADQLSTFICLEELGDNGARATIAAAEAFQIESSSSNPEELPFYDEHSLQPQRFYNLLCYLYGKDENRYQNIVSNGLLPEPRAVRCSEEYGKVKRSWENLLKPFRK